LGEKLYRSYGEVWAQTQRQITVSVPLTYYPAVPDGFVAMRPTITFLAWEIPLYANGTLDDSYKLWEQPHFLQANGLTLPLGITNRYYIRTVQQKTARTEAQAAALALKRLAAQEAALFTAGGYEEIERKEAVQAGVYTLTVQYRCRENIAAEVPLA
jgi:hypothetical protein